MSLRPDGIELFSCRRIGVAILIVAAWLMQVVAVHAQQSPLKLSVRREWEGARSSAPLGLRAYVKWSDPSLLEGRLQIESYLDQRLIGTWTGNDTALADNEQYFWFMSPRPILQYEGQRYVLKTEFQSPQQSFPIEELDVEVPENERRVMVVAIVVAEVGLSPTGLRSTGERAEFEQPLLLQQKLSADDASALHVHLSRVLPVDLPSDALRYLGLDAMIVSHDTLKLFKSNQMEALSQWVLAGGNLVLIQTGELEGEAAKFVKNLSRDDQTFIRRRDPRWPMGTSLFAPGLGRFYHTTKELDGGSDAWKTIAWDMLRLGYLPRAALNGGRMIDLPRSNTPQQFNQSFGAQPVPSRGSWSPQSRINVDDLTTALLPKGIRGMPFGLAVSVLAGCVFCIGPGDYFLLGLIRRRRWTWVLFPLITLGFTGWMAQLAAEHNGQNDTRTWISIVDITPQNEVLRTSRLELNYGASSRVATHDVQSQWWVDLRQDDLGWKEDASSYNPYGNPYGRSTVERTYPDLGPRLAYEGTAPSNYKVYEPVRQWAPRMQRITTLGADPALAEYPLPKADWMALHQTKTSEMAAALKPIFGDRVEATWWLDRRKPRSADEWHGPALPSATALNVPLAFDPTSSVLGAVRTLTRPDDQGVFSLVTELAPTAGPDCEDIGLRSQPSLVIIQEVEPGRYLVTRVIYPPE